MDLHQLGFIVVHEYKEVSSLILTWFCSEIRSGVFGNLWIWFCCWSLAWNPEISRWILRSSSSLVQNREILSLFFTNSSSVIVPDSLLLAMNLALELQRHSSMMMIQWWISENCSEFHRIVLESWFWEIRVFSCSWAFLSLLWFLILTAKREKNGICLWWCGLHWMDLMALCTVTGLL